MNKIAGALLLAGAALLLGGCGSTAGARTEDTQFHNLIEDEGVHIDVSSVIDEDHHVDDAIDHNLNTSWTGREGAKNTFTVDFGKEISASCLRISWGEILPGGYSVSESSDGDSYTTLYSCGGTPYVKETIVPLSSDFKGRYLRLTVQGSGNLCEIGLYETNPWESIEEGLSCEVTEGRRLVLNGLPGNVTAKYISADREQVIGERGRILDTLEDKTVHVGYRLTFDDWSVTTGDLEVVVPASQEASGTNEKPAVIPEIQEWAGGTGTIPVDSSVQVTSDGNEDAQAAAQTLQERIRDLFGSDSTGSGVQTRIVLDTDGEESLGEEGYTMDLNAESGEIRISAAAKKGLYWGTITLLQMIKEEEEGGTAQLPAGQIRDYPTSPVRGFTLDAAAGYVSMDTLEKIADALSWYKMNDFSIHLSDDDGTQAAYRMESEITGENGESVSSELCYTAEEFSSFTAMAQDLGISVVPEISSPSHALSFTSAYPELALQDSPDTFDLSNPGSAELVQRIWQEQLGSAFSGCDAVSPGGDSYAGSTQDFIAYESLMISYLQSQGKNVRLWGSLSSLRGIGTIDPGGLQIGIWNTDNADPLEAYGGGYGILNMNHRQLAIVPGQQERLDISSLYRDFAVNRFPEEDGSGEVREVPAYRNEMLGAEYSLWNEEAFSGEGLSEEEIYTRFLEALPVIAQKTWNDTDSRSFEEFSSDAAVLGDMSPLR